VNANKGKRRMAIQMMMILGKRMERDRTMTWRRSNAKRNVKKRNKRRDTESSRK